MKVAVIGGGAAGFYAALSAKEHHPRASVVLFEKSSKLLAKVKVSGGGRCNVTNGETSSNALAKGYPRGEKFMKNTLRVFGTLDTRQWFESRNVQLKTEADGRVFPVSDNSQTVIDCLLRETRAKKIDVMMKHSVKVLKSLGGKWQIEAGNETLVFDKVVVATGGSPKREGLNWLEEFGHEIVDPVPSLFTFNLPKNPICQLMGLVSQNTSVSIQGTKLKSNGPLLITHWGFSGPAVLKLSSFGARIMANKNYSFYASVNWVGQNPHLVESELQKIANDHPSKKLTNIRPFDLPDRLWQFLLMKAFDGAEKRWNELGKKGLNKLVELLTNDIYEVSGKTTFKEEFVTCGGVSLASIDQKTMQSKVAPGLYFAGEVLDIDGITGGYNFQAAWTTGWIAGQLN